MNRHMTVAAAVVAISVSASIAETTVMEEFEGGSNEAGWSFIAGGDTIEDFGGNPGAWLHQPTYDTFAPTLTTSDSTDTAFVGDYREMGVVQVGLSARTDDTDFNTEGLPFAILLRDTKGTPNVDDDDYAYWVSLRTVIPQPGDGWVEYAFDIPSQSMDSVPTGWSGGWVGDGEQFRPGVDWNDVITSVDRVEFWWIHPAWFAIFQQWDVGADSIWIAMEMSECDGDANGDGTVDPLDSGYVLARFGCPVGEGDPACDAADQNGDGAVDPLDSGFVLARFGECP